MQQITWLITLLVIPSVLLGNSTAYVVGSGGELGQGCMSLLPLSGGRTSAPVFVPPAGGLIAIAPVSHQVWDLTSDGLTIYILSPESGSVLATISLPGPVESLPVFSPDGLYAYLIGPTSASGPQGIIKIDALSRTIIRTAAASLTGYPAIASDGSKIFAVSGSEVEIFDTTTLANIGAIAVKGSYLEQIFVVGETLVVASAVSSTTQVNYLDVQTRKQINSIVLPSVGELVAVSPDATRIYEVVFSLTNEINAFDFSTGQLLAARSLPSTQNGAATYLSPDGSKLISVGNPVLVLDPNTLATVAEPLPLGLSTYAALLNNDILLTFYSAASAMTLIDQDTATVIGTFPLADANPYGGVAGSNREVVYVGAALAGNSVAFSTSADKTVSVLATTDTFLLGALARDQLYGAIDFGTENGVFDLLTGIQSQLPPPVRIEAGFAYQYFPGAVPPSQNTYWSPFAVIDNEVDDITAGMAVYDTRTNQVVGRFEVPYGEFFPTLVFSPDSSIAYVSEPSGIALYSTSTLQQITTYSTQPFISLLISPSGAVIYGRTYDAIYIVDAATGAEKQLVTLVSGSDMALSPDGTTLFATDLEQNLVYLVNTSTGSVVSVTVPYISASVIVI